MASIISPNNLSDTAVRYDGVCTEHEHANHPTYHFPVVAEYVGVVPVDLAEWDDSYRPATLALIYSDGNVALTLHEACYDLWRLDDGAHLHGQRWFADDWQLCEESRDLIRERRT